LGFFECVMLQTSSLTVTTTCNIPIHTTMYKYHCLAPLKRIRSLRQPWPFSPSSLICDFSLSHLISLDTALLTVNCQSYCDSVHFLSSLTSDPFKTNSVTMHTSPVVAQLTIVYLPPLYSLHCVPRFRYHAGSISHPSLIKLMDRPCVYISTSRVQARFSYGRSHTYGHILQWSK